MKLAIVKLGITIVLGAGFIPALELALIGIAIGVHRIARTLHEMRQLAARIFRG